MDCISNLNVIMLVSVCQFPIINDMYLIKSRNRDICLLSVQNQMFVCVDLNARRILSLNKHIIFIIIMGSIIKVNVCASGSLDYLVEINTPVLKIFQ